MWQWIFNVALCETTSYHSELYKIHYFLYSVRLFITIYLCRSCSKIVPCQTLVRDVAAVPTLVECVIFVLVSLLGWPILAMVASWAHWTILYPVTLLLRPIGLVALVGLFSVWLCTTSRLIELLFLMKWLKNFIICTHTEAERKLVFYF